jgi:urease accessory protein
MSSTSRGVRPILVTLLAAGAASAHAPVEGLSDFYNGILHPFFSLPHLLSLIALSFFLGQHREHDNTWPVMGFLVSLVVSLGCASFSIGFPASNGLLFAGGALGFMILLNLRWPVWARALAAVAIGLMMGFDFASEIVDSKLALNTGTALTLYFCLLYGLVLSEALSKKKWQQIGVRVAGSWIAACAMLVLSLTLLHKKT